MVLRLFRGSSCVDVFINIERVVYNSVGKLEFKYQKNDKPQWKHFYIDKDFDSFILAPE